jgi:RHS repeat-associated protein
MTGCSAVVQRYYSSVTGRFWSPDPYRARSALNDPQNWNRYSYTGGDPVNRADPRGLDWITVGYWNYVGYDEYKEQEIWEWIEVSIWVDDDPGAAGSSSGAVASSGPWSDTNTALKRSANRIATGVYSEDCVTLIHRLKTAKGSELRVSAVRDQAAGAILANATTSNQIGTLILPDRTVTGPIWSFFDPKSANYVKGLYAFAPLSGSTSYWAPGSQSGIDENKLAGMVMHEILHNMGFTDTAMQDAFKIAVTGATDNISEKLATDCFGYRR